MPQALTSPISFFRATPPPPASDPASPPLDSDVVPRCLGPSLIALIELLDPLTTALGGLLAGAFQQQRTIPFGQVAVDAVSWR